MIHQTKSGLVNKSITIRENINEEDMLISRNKTNIRNEKSKELITQENNKIEEESSSFSWSKSVTEESLNNRVSNSSKYSNIIHTKYRENKGKF